MSHVVFVSVTFQNIDELKAACSLLALEESFEFRTSQSAFLLPCLL